MVKFGAEHSKSLLLKVIDFRIPERGELYVDKNGHVQRCNEHRYSRHARARLICKESWEGVPVKYNG